MIEMVIFDMAGTTVDEDNLVYKTVQKAIQNKGFEVSLEMVLAFGAGKEKLDAIRDVLNEVYQGKVEEVTVQNIFSSFKQMLAQAYDVEPIHPQPGAEKVFKALQSEEIKVVLNTGYDRKTAKQLLKRLDWLEHEAIDLVVTASEVNNGRPNPDMIHLAMDRLAINNPKAVVKIGDSAVDIEEGKRAGCHLNIGITTGAQNAEQLQKASPSAIIHHLEELLPLIEAHTS